MLVRCLGASLAYSVCFVAGVFGWSLRGNWTCMSRKLASPAAVKLFQAFSKAVVRPFPPKPQCRLCFIIKWFLYSNRLCRYLLVRYCMVHAVTLIIWAWFLPLNVHCSFFFSHTYAKLYFCPTALYFHCIFDCFHQVQRLEMYYSFSIIKKKR